jgi:purine-nucleoside phosphorylase
MYKAFTAPDIKRHYGFPKSYKVEGFLVYGTYQDSPYETVAAILATLGFDARIRQLPHKFFKDIMEFTVEGKVYWFVTAYGGALLSEWLHIACLFGSKRNLVIGKCGGLFKEAESGDIILPTFSFANESTTRAYNPNDDNRHQPSGEIVGRLHVRLANEHKIWLGPTVTYQAMLAETVEDIKNWSEEGYYGVEMEAGTVFAVSNHFGVPSAGALMISDNLIKEETVLDANYEEARQGRNNIMHNLIKVTVEEMLGLPIKGLDGKRTHR